MTDITSALSKVQLEETKYGSAVSEYTQTKIGASINYIIDNYQPLSYVTIGNYVDSVDSRVFTFIAPYRLRVFGFHASLAGEFLAIGDGTRSVSVSSPFSTGAMSFSRTVGATTPGDFYGIATSYGIQSNYDANPSAVTPIVLNPGDTTTITVAASGTGAFDVASSAIGIIIQKELAP